MEGDKGDNGRTGPADAADPLLGQVLQERYRLVRRVEERAGARVYAAEHLLADRAVAIEIVDAAPASIDRFLEDARTIARVGHENVVEIYNGGRSPAGAPFLATEVVEGTDLVSLLAKEGPLLWDRARDVALQIAAALGALHRHGVTHGGLAAENVVLAPRGARRDFVKLVDLGVARARGAAAGRTDANVDDLLALGRLTYQMVTGQAPTEPPAAPSALRPAGTLPADLDGVLLRALETAPDKRWPDVAAFADAVSRCRLTRRQSVRVEALAIAELSGKTGAFEAHARRRRRVWQLASVGAAVVLACAVLYVLKTSPGHVQISTVPADADLTFNGLPVQARSPVVLDAPPGRYTLVVSRAGYVPAERTIEVGARSTVSVPVELVAAPPPLPAPPDVPPPAPAAGALPTPAPAP